MPKRACTSDNIMAWIVANAKSRGAKIPQLDSFLLNDIDNGGRAVYNEITNQAAAGVYENLPKTPQNASDNTALSFLQKQLDEKIIQPTKLVAKFVITDNKRAEGKYGEEVVKPVIEFIQGHLEKYRDNLADGGPSYFEGIKQVFEKIDTTRMPESILRDFNNYKQYHIDGGRLYPKNSARPAVLKVLSNVSGNLIQASPTIILGNPLELAMKLPALYPKEMFPALWKTIKNGKIFMKVPELDAKGIYDTFPEDGGGILKKFVLAATDNPLKTAFYYAGELKGGVAGGIEAVEKGAYKYRMGNETNNEMSDVGRVGISFLNYTLNTYRMQAAWLKGLTSPKTFVNSARGLLTYYAVAGAIGGWDASIPEPVQWIIRAANPELADQIDESRTPLTRLVKLGTIDSVFITGLMLTRTFQNASRDFRKAMTHFENGDIGRSAVHVTNATLLPLAKTTNFLGIGDAQVQKIIKIAEDIAFQDLELGSDDFYKRLQKDFIPFTLEK